MDYIVTEMTMSRFRRYYEEMRPSGHMHYYNANDRLRSGFPGNRLKYANIPRLEVSFDVDYIAFSFNPNRIVLGNSAGRITFNRVEKILMYIHMYGVKVEQRKINHSFLLLQYHK